MTLTTIAPVIEQDVREQIEDLAIREINTPEVEAEVTVELARLAGHRTSEDRAFWFGELQEALVDRQRAHDGDIPAVDCTDEQWTEACDVRVDEAFHELIGLPND
jgi:hypothetical protein